MKNRLREIWQQTPPRSRHALIALALLLTHPGSQFAVPLWVKFACAIAMGLGTMSGGWRIIR